jgi:L-iditol 2-dehydrogenase
MRSGTILAAFVGGPAGVEVKEIPKPELDSGSVMVRMKASGICGTDIEKLSGAYTASTVLGHEVAGIVSESRSDLVSEGDFVIPHHHVACGSCLFCERGAETMCDGFRQSNFVPGGFSEEFKVPNYNVERHGVHKFEGISFESASFVEPIGCCIRGLQKALGLKYVELSDGKFESKESLRIQNVLVVGAGPIGLMHMELMRAFQPAIKLVAVDISNTRLEYARKFEYAYPINPKESKDNSFAPEAKKESPEGLGFDFVIVATANESAFAQAMQCVRKAGRMLLFGAMHKGSTFSLNLQRALLEELFLVCSYATTEKEMDQALQLLQQKMIGVEKFATGRFPLDRIEDAMNAAKSEKQVKVLITP